jgi:hypothetical protein
MLRLLLSACVCCIATQALADDCNREWFYKSWPIEDGMDLRQKIFQERSTTKVEIAETKSGRKRVFVGTWTDELTGDVYRAKNPNAFYDDIEDEEQKLGIDLTNEFLTLDHVIPLQWACEHGADAWTPQKRKAFATDRSLLRITLNRVNSSKNDQGLPIWTPASEEVGIALTCDYATSFVYGLLKYQFDLSDAEWLAMIKRQQQICALASGS